MKKFIFHYMVILLLIAFSQASFGQDNRTLDTKVADLLAQMPTRDLVHRDILMDEIFELGPEGFSKISGFLAAPGQGDDVAVRFAVNSFAMYASQFGKCNEREFAEKNLLQALEEHEDKNVKAFIIRQLNYVGGEATVSALSSCLRDKDLVEPATQSLLLIAAPESAALFMDALNDVDDQSKITLIRALGELKCKEAVAMISPYASSGSVSMRRTSIAALANIASPGSYKIMQKAASNVGFKYEETLAAGSFLAYADRLGEDGEIETMKKACKAVFKSNKDDDLLHNYSAALSIYSKHLGYEVSPLLLDAVDHPNKAFRYSVLNIAEKTGGIADTRKWIDKSEVSSHEVQADIISMLGRRGCEMAVAHITKSLDSSSELVRRESLIALGKLQGSKAIPVLTEHLKAGKDLETTAMVLNLLLDKEHLYHVAGLLNKTSSRIKAACIALIAGKAGTQYFDEIFALLSSTDSFERAAACKALKQVSAYENVDLLLEQLNIISDPVEIKEIQEAIVHAIKDIKAEQGSNGKVLSFFKTTENKERIIGILPEIGGPLALEAVTASFISPDNALKKTSFDALASWKDYSASKYLYEICKDPDSEFKQEAFRGFVALVQSARLPDDQKLLQYRKIMPFASSKEDQESVISSIGTLKTFLSLVYLEQYLDDKDLAEETSSSIMKIALPGNNGKNGMSGEIVRRILLKTDKAMEGIGDQYERINLRKYLDEMPGETGFESMFNGENFDGWQGLVGNPLSRAKMDTEELAKKQADADKKVTENWSIKDGKIIFNGKGHNLCSVKHYGDFEMIVDWLINKKGDSGIYLRGTPQVQIWDTSRVEVGAQVGSGGLYNNNKDNVRDPLKVADNPVGEWNTFRITMIGANVTVYLNGELVADNVRMDNYWDRSIPIFDRGPIELQAHGNELAFRDLYIREINSDQLGLSQDEIEEGFVSLFNGRNLDEWQGNKTDYYVENGEMVVNPKRGGHGNLFTVKEYSDFIYRFEFKLTPGANNGLGIRAPLEGNAAYQGMELQILDNTAPVYANLKKYQYHGSVYGTIPAKRGYLKPVGEWNSQEVVVKGSKIKVTLNDEVILDGDISEARDHGTPDGRKHPGLKREKGYIGYLGHGSELYFRNIRIKDLSK